MEFGFQLIDYWPAMVEIFDIHNTHIMITFVITFLFGFGQYVYSFLLCRREGLGPFPMFMHTTYFAHDTTWAVLFFLGSMANNWNPWFMAISICHVIWPILEFYNFWHAVNNEEERKEVFTKYFKDPSKKQAWAVIIFQCLIFYGIYNLAIHFMGPGSYFQTAIITNVIMAFGPGLLWLKRGSRRGAGMGIALEIFLCTINWTLPWTSMWVAAMPEIFDQPWYYITGVVCCIISGAYLVIMKRFPEKEPDGSGKKPIW